MRVLGIEPDAIRLGLGEAVAPGDGFVLCDVAGRRWDTRLVPAAGGATLRFKHRPSAGVYVIEWRSDRGRVATKAVVLH